MSFTNPCGGVVYPQSYLANYLAGGYDGIAFRISNPQTHDSVALEVLSAYINPTSGIQLLNRAFPQNPAITFCNLQGGDRQSSPSQFEFEFKDILQQISPGDPYLGYITEQEFDLLVSNFPDPADVDSSNEILVTARAEILGSNYLNGGERILRFGLKLEPIVEVVKLINPTESAGVPFFFPTMDCPFKWTEIGGAYTAATSYVKKAGESERREPAKK